MCTYCHIVSLFSVNMGKYHHECKMAFIDKLNHRNFQEPLKNSEAFWVNDQNKGSVLPLFPIKLRKAILGDGDTTTENQIIEYFLKLPLGNFLYRHTRKIIEP